MSIESIAHLQEGLVESIRKHVQDQKILDAFRIVPRHEFVGDFLTLNEDNRTWSCVQKWSPGWLERVYTDIQLVTSVNQYNKPNVSSSMPSIMAKKITSLNLQPQSRVLEIGTGTGYNAAILAHLVGNENVVTVDINEALLVGAQQNIDRVVGPGVTVLHVDGRNIPESLGKFDAVLVAASAQCIERSWIAALNQDGRLIVNWNKAFSKVFFELTKQGDELVGKVARYSGDFMGLHDGSGVASMGLQWDKQAPILEDVDFRSELMENFDFGFFLQIHCPSLAYSRFQGKTSGQYYYAVIDDRSRIAYFSTKVRGDASLWQEIQSIHEKFVSLGQPRRKELSLKVAGNGDMKFFYQGKAISES